MSERYEKYIIDHSYLNGLSLVSYHVITIKSCVNLNMIILGSAHHLIFINLYATSQIVIFILNFMLLFKRLRCGIYYTLTIITLE